MLFFVLSLCGALLSGAQSSVFAAPFALTLVSSHFLISPSLHSPRSAFPSFLSYFVVASTRLSS